MSIIIKHEPPGVVVEFNQGNRDVFQKGTHRAKIEGDKLWVYTNDNVEKIKLADSIDDITAIYDKGASVSVPATIQEAFDIIWIFFLANNQYRRITMPLTQESDENVAYTGFSMDLEALTSEAKWAVKKMYFDRTEQWAGRSIFDQILDDYLSLSYS